MKVHRKLVMFAEIHQVNDPEAFADKTLDMLQHRERTGRIKNPGGLAYVLARDLLKEYWRQKASLPIPLSARIRDQLSSQANSAEPNDALLVVEKRDECLHRCLDKLSTEENALILAYYGSQEGFRKLYQVRTQLAFNRGVKPRTLAVIIHRIHKKLDPCVLDCVGRPTDV